MDNTTNNKAQGTLIENIDCDKCGEFVEIGVKVCPYCGTNLFNFWELDMQAQAFKLEKEGRLVEARKLYQTLIDVKFNGSNPYERMRIICAKQKDYAGAVKACEAYIGLNVNYGGYERKCEKMKIWIRKYHKKMS